MVQVKNGFTTSNSPTLSCPDTEETYGGSYRLKVGLLTADEMVLAGESYQVQNSSYLSLNDSAISIFWSMSPILFNSLGPQTWIELNQVLFNSMVSLQGAYLRPVINVTPNNGFTSGDGTTSNPYVIS